MKSSTSPPKIKVRAIYISDLHLGSKSSQCDALLAFLRRYEFEELYLLGDIIDCDELKRTRHWVGCYRKLMHFLLKLPLVCYIPGNHDSFFRQLLNQSINNIYICEDYVVDRGKSKILLVHGDQFDSLLGVSSKFYRVGGYLYSRVLFINRQSQKLGIRWNFARILKRKVKSLVSYIGRFEDKAINLAKDRGCDRVIAGHIHHPTQKMVDGVEYLNCGDWVENCSGIIEDYNGELSLEFYGD